MRKAPSSRSTWKYHSVEDIYVYYKVVTLTSKERSSTITYSFTLKSLFRVLRLILAMEGHSDSTDASQLRTYYTRYNPLISTLSTLSEVLLEFVANEHITSIADTQQPPSILESDRAYSKEPIVSSSKTAVPAASSVTA